ncbi:hypothetical protein KAW43_01410 [Candidatus Parcubacteria bacterium]|jgi:hypothetical protein|nr:hypothetical protein [Candidatus Parcubacteria bacterium]
MPRGFLEKSYFKGVRRRLVEKDTGGTKEEKGGLKPDKEKLEKTTRMKLVQEAEENKKQKELEETREKLEKVSEN